MKSPLLSVEQAQQKLLASVGKKNGAPTKTVPIEQALHKICALTINSDINIPPSDNSAMDGFAINTEDVHTSPASLKISDRIIAGDVAKELPKGSAARIFTGANVPRNANTVVIQENCHYDQNTVTINKYPQAGQNIRRAGEDIAKGEPLLSAGDKISPAHIGILASAGLTEININADIKIGLLSSGNELIEPGLALPEGKIYNSNSRMLDALVKKLDIRTTKKVHVNDNFERSCDELSLLSEQCDLIISTGGVSVGEEDHIHAAIEALGHIDFYKVAMKPGKPILKGTINNKPILGLPGNPSSTLVTFLLFAVPLIKKLQGHNKLLCIPYKVAANFDMNEPKKRCEYRRVQRTSDGIIPHNNQSSGALKAAAWADGLAQINANTVIKCGDPIPYFPYSDFFS